MDLLQLDGLVESLGTLANAGFIAVNPKAPAGGASTSMPVSLTHEDNGPSFAVPCQASTCADALPGCRGKLQATIAYVVIHHFKGMLWGEPTSIATIWMCHRLTYLPPVLSAHFAAFPLEWAKEWEGLECCAHDTQSPRFVNHKRQPNGPRPRSGAGSAFAWVRGIDPPLQG